MRVAALADQHGHLPEVPPCDLLLLAGDLCPATNHSPPFQAAWLDGPFRRWLRGLPARKVIGIAGNHDFVFEERPGLVPDLPWTYLQDGGCEWEGVRVYGSPWQPVFGGWAFNAEWDKRQAAWALIPADTQVLVLHGPPHGYGDLVPNREPPADDHEWPGGEHVGCPHLLARLRELPALQLAVFGHIHGGYGQWRLAPGGPILANVAVKDEQYQPTREPTVWDADLAARTWTRVT